MLQTGTKKILLAVRANLPSPSKLLKRVEGLPQENCAIFNLAVGTTPSISAFVNSQGLMLSGPVEDTFPGSGKCFLNFSPFMAAVALRVGTELR